MSLIKQKFRLENPENFKKQAMVWAGQFETAACLNSNHFKDQYHQFDLLISAGVQRELTAQAGGALDQLDAFIANCPLYISGFLGYDLKNEIETLESRNWDGLGFPDLYFFIPQYQLIFKGDEVEISAGQPAIIYQFILAIEPLENSTNFKGQLQQRLNRESYISAVSKLKEHIHRGDIYEVNFCQEFYAEDAELNPLAAYFELNECSPTPFSNFFKLGDRYIISATPERFICKRQDKLSSQPIKGTARRSADTLEDEKMKAELRASEKERAENVMIVDLVRNDLTKCALPGTVKVDELCEIYSFEQVHQMISTVSCRLAEGTSLSHILRSSFPMGSMTGAPKIRAMQLIETFEQTRRGVYSGSVGYMAPNGDFDFNVIIRTMLYDANRKYLSFQVGSAITHQAIPENEYDECLLKAKAILQVLKSEII